VRPGRHSIAVFYGLACALSWCAWLPLAAASRGYAVPAVSGQHYLGALGPILAAFVVTFFSSGIAGIAELGRRMIRWRVGLRWFLIAIFGPFALYAISAVGVGLTTGHWPDFSQFGRSDEFPTLGVVGAFLIHTLTFGFGEEVGWRGFALPRLQTRHRALTATLVLTAFWACWHLPAFFYRPGYSAMGAGEIAGWFLSLFTGAILLTWLYNSSRGSILIAALFHGSIDLAFTSKPIDAAVMNTMGALIVLWAIGVVAITGSTNLSLRARQQLRADE